jgi:hypothetical protein
MLRRIIDEYRDIRKESRSTMSDAFSKNNGASQKPTVVEMVLAQGHAVLPWRPNHALPSVDGCNVR